MNKLKLYPDKMEIILLGELERYQPDLNRITLHLEDQVCRLCILLDAALSMEAQIFVVAKSALHQPWTAVPLPGKEVSNDRGLGVSKIRLL